MQYKKIGCHQKFKCSILEVASSTGVSQIPACPTPLPPFYLLPSNLAMDPRCPGYHNFLSLTKNGVIIAATNYTSHRRDEKLKLSNFMARS